MAVYKSPGVYINEITFGTPIGTAIGNSPLFIGRSTRGKVNTYEYISSWEDFRVLMGELDKNSLLSYVVEAYFKMSKTPCYVMRIAGSGATASSISGSITSSFTIKARSEGTWGNNLTLDVTASTDSTKRTYEVKLSGDTVEVWKDKTNTEFANVDSNYLTITKVSDTLPSVGTYSFTGGSDGSTPTVSDYTSSTVQNEIKKIKDDIDTVTITDIYISSSLIPDATVTGLSDSDISTLIDSYISFCKDNKLLLTCNVPYGKSVSSKVSFKSGLTNETYSSYKMYGEFVKVYDSRTDGYVYLPVANIVPALNTVTDNRVGYWKAVAGTVDGHIPIAIDIDVELSSSDLDTLYSNNINPTIKKKGYGILVWGDRTGSTDADYKFGNVRRFMNITEKVIKSYLENKLFESNDSKTWNAIISDLSGYFDILYEAGALKGENKNDAYFIKCDDELNGQYEIDNGILKVRVGLAVNKPAEFIVLEISASIRK